MNLAEIAATGKFVVTSEVGPPKGVDAEEMFHEADMMKDYVDAVNVTDIQSAVMRLGSLPVCHMLKDRGIEPVLQITCRDRNRLALQTELLNAHVLDIENVLLLTGDYPSLGDHPGAYPVFDFDSVQYLQVAKQMRDEGKDMMGNELQGSPKLCLGAVVNPGAEPLEPQIIKLRKKVEAGAQFIQTQAVYDPGQFEKFMNAVDGIGVPILVGIVLLKSVGMARFMNANVAGVFVPEDLIQEMKGIDKADRPKKSVEIAGRLIREMKDMCQGTHIMPLGWDKYVADVVKEAGLA